MMLNLIGTLGRPLRKLQRWLAAPTNVQRLPYKQTDLSLELTRDTVPLHLLPGDTDEVLAAGFRQAQSDIKRILSTCGCQVAKVEIRRRLSKREYRAYISISTSIEIDRLYSMEPLVRNNIQQAHQIEIADFYWTFSSDKELTEVA
jgi:hypothetical protein